MNFDIGGDTTGLLVSVRNSGEALEALAGRANVIDVKEPTHGSLGAADFPTIADVVRVVDGRAPVTAALGELIDLSSVTGTSMQLRVPPGVSLFKIGLAGCGATSDWQLRWQNVIESLLNASTPRSLKPVAVVYADWKAANAPAPALVLREAISLDCPALLIDTWDKSAGPLFTHWPPEELRRFMQRVRAHNRAVVLAGSLLGENFRLAAELQPNLVAVRSAACNGGRNGHVTRQRVAQLKSELADVIGMTPLSASKTL